MKWTTTNYKGERVTWYSEDEYLRSISQLEKENQYQHEIIVALKEKIDKQVKTSKCAWKHFEGTLCPEGDKYKQCLRKIKEIAKANQFYFGAGTIVSYQTIKQIATNFEKILDLITIAESEK